METATEPEYNFPQSPRAMGVKPYAIMDLDPLINSAIAGSHTIKDLTLRTHRRLEDNDNTYSSTSEPSPSHDRLAQSTTLDNAPRVWPWHHTAHSTNGLSYGGKIPNDNIYPMSPHLHQRLNEKSSRGLFISTAPITVSRKRGLAFITCFWLGVELVIVDCRISLCT